MAEGDVRFWIRPMTEDDLGKVAELEAEVFSDPWSPGLWESSLGQGTFVGLVLADPLGKRLLGYVCGQFVLDEGELHRIAVEPSFRGQGLGQALLERFLLLGRERGLARLFLEVREGNGPARALYQKNGFVFLGMRKNYYQNPREDAVILEKFF